MRIIEVFNKELNNWIVTPFENLRVADIFRIFDDGERYIDENKNSVWIVDSTPYHNGDGQLTINTLYW